MMDAVAEPPAKGKMAALKVRALEAAFADLKAFYRLFWEKTDPEPYIACWHLDLIADELMAVERGETRRLLVNVPPGSAKSLMISVFFPAWMLARRPSWRSLYISATEALAERDSIRCRSILDNPWYLQLKQVAHAKHGVPLWEIKKDRDTKLLYMTTALGGREAAGLTSGNTGKRADMVVIDDPVDVQKFIGGITAIRAHIDNANAIINKSLMSRVNNPKTSPIVMVMQRLAEDDPAGIFARKKGVKRVSLPATGAPENEHRHPRDLRQAGEMLSPRYYRDYLDERREEMGSVQYEAQYEQQTRPSSGTMFKEAWVHLPGFRHRITSLAAFEDSAITIDTTFSGGPETDWCVVQAWGRIGAVKYLVDSIRGRWDYNVLRDKVRAFTLKHSSAKAVYIETAANGKALISDFQAIVSGVIGVKPEGDKRSRANFTAIGMEAGQIRVLDDDLAEIDESGQLWTTAWLNEHLGFPTMRHDDQVDATSQLLFKWHEGTFTAAQFAENLANAVEEMDAVDTLFG